MRSGDVVVGIDLGQSGCKGCVIDVGGGVVATAQHAYPTSYPHPGWAEQDPDHWVAAAERAFRDLLAAGVGRVAAVGVSAATHNAVLLGANGTPVRPCITLRDHRAAEQARGIAREHGPYVLASTRNPAGAGWTLPQLRWVAEHERDIWRRTQAIVFMKDYVRGALTGDRVTDRIDAEGSLLFDVGRRNVDERLCALVPVAPELLPPVHEPAAVVGRVTPQAAARTGLPAGTPVVAGCSDTAAEALAAGAVHDGAAVVKLATAGNVNAVTTTPRPSTWWFTYSHPVDGLHYHTMGTNSAAASRAWLHRILGADGPDAFAQLDAEAATVPPGAGGVLFHPYLAGERAPVFEATLRGAFIGLHAGHTRAHLVRAVLEGVALSLLECARVFDREGIASAETMLVGGGARSQLWSQITADALGRPLVRPRLAEASAGAALLAAVGAGMFPDTADAARAWTGADGLVVPDPGRTRLYAALLEIYQAARDAVAPSARALQALAGE